MISSASPWPDPARLHLPVVPVLGEDFRKQSLEAETRLERLSEKASRRDK